MKVIRQVVGSLILWRNQVITSGNLSQRNSGCRDAWHSRGRCAIIITNFDIVADGNICIQFNSITQVKYFCCCCSVAKFCLTLCNSMDCSTPGFPVLHDLPEFTQIHVHWVGDATQPFHPLSPPSPLPSVFPTIKVFPNELSLRIKGPKYWELQFQNLSSQWIFRVDFFRIDWFDFLAVQETLKTTSNHFSGETLPGSKLVRTHMKAETEGAKQLDQGRW